MYKKVDTIIFDMDGTIADLYNHPEWLPMIRSEKNIFNLLEPMVAPFLLDMVIKKLQTVCEVKVITWLPMNATSEYKKVCTKDKKSWISTFFPSIKKVHAIQYGAKKHYVKGLSENAVIFDDNKQVRAEWAKSGRIAFDETNIIKTLLNIYMDKVKD